MSIVGTLINSTSMTESMTIGNTSHDFYVFFFKIKMAFVLIFKKCVFEPMIEILLPLSFRNSDFTDIRR